MPRSRRSSTDVACEVAGGLLGAGERPAEAGEFAGDGDRDDRATLAALLSEPAPDVVQAALRLPRDLDDGGGLSLLAALEGGAAGWVLALVPRGLDQQPAGVLAAGLGDLPLAAAFARAAL